MKYILPGMGANSNMYSGPWREIEDCCFIDWPPYKQEKSITDVANRLIEKHHIGQEDIVIGSSMGGMVGLEMANTMGLKLVILVGSATNPSEISPLSKLLMPFSFKPVVKLSQLVASISKDAISQAYYKSDSDFIVEMSKAILNWHGYKGSGTQIGRIHGKNDKFITCPNDCETIDKGGHLIAITHAHECVNYINSLTNL
jgi:pimeloyl-ACP methyl ester carboxylesterase